MSHTCLLSIAQCGTDGENPCKDWRPVVAGMGVSGWQLACVIQTPLLLQPSFSTYTMKLLMVFQRRLVHGYAKLKQEKLAARQHQEITRADYLRLRGPGGKGSEGFFGTLKGGSHGEAYFHSLQKRAEAESEADSENHRNGSSDKDFTMSAAPPRMSVSTPTSPILERHQNQVDTESVLDGSLKREMGLSESMSSLAVNGSHSSDLEEIDIPVEHTSFGTVSSVPNESTSSTVQTESGDTTSSTRDDSLGTTSISPISDSTVSVIQQEYVLQSPRSSSASTVADASAGSDVRAGVNYYVGSHGIQRLRQAPIQRQQAMENNDNDPETVRIPTYLQNGPVARPRQVAGVAPRVQPPQRVPQADERQLNSRANPGRGDPDHPANVELLEAGKRKTDSTEAKPRRPSVGTEKSGASTSKVFRPIQRSLRPPKLLTFPSIATKTDSAGSLHKTDTQEELPPRPVPTSSCDQTRMGRIHHATVLDPAEVTKRLEAIEQSRGSPEPTLKPFSTDQSSSSRSSVRALTPPKSPSDPSAAAGRGRSAFRQCSPSGTPAKQSRSSSVPSENRLKTESDALSELIQNLTNQTAKEYPSFKPKAPDETQTDGMMSLSGSKHISSNPELTRNPTTQYLPVPTQCPTCPQERGHTPVRPSPTQDPYMQFDRDETELSSPIQRFCIRRDSASWSSHVVDLFLTEDVGSDKRGVQAPAAPIVQQDFNNQNVNSPHVIQQPSPSDRPPAYPKT